MKRTGALCWVLALAFVAVPVAGFAQEAGEAGEAAEDERDGRSLWRRYTDYVDSIIEQVDSMDLYGVTAQLPQGVFKFKVDYNHRRAAGRYTSHRQRTEMLEPIVFGEEDSPMLELDLGASGGGEGITLQFSYGVTDPLDFYFELTLINLDVELRPKLRRIDPTLRALINSYTPDGYPDIEDRWFDGSVTKDRYMNQAAEWFLNYLPRLGRPSMWDGTEYDPSLGPGKGYHSTAELADINLGFSWNFFRNSRWSGAFTGRVYLPTGKIADPNNSLTLGTGPKIDWGTGSFGVGFTQGYDLRLFRYKYWIDIILSAEFTAAYYFKHHRRYPDFPQQTDDAKRFIDALSAVEPGVGSYFPDMSHLTGKSYGYTPGFGAAAQMMLGLQFLFFDFGIGVGYQYVSEPELDADYLFEVMVRSLELQLAGHYEIMEVAAGLTLIPLYIPLSVHYKYQKSIGGRNTLIFDQNHFVVIEGVIPVLY